MPADSRAIGIAGPLGAGLLLAASASFPAENGEFGVLHPADGVEITYDVCTACHSEMIVAQQGQTREGWDELLTWMVEEQGMEPLSDSERTEILDYLSTHYNTDRPHFPR